MELIKAFTFGMITALPTVSTVFVTLVLFA